MSIIVLGVNLVFGVLNVVVGTRGLSHHDSLPAAHAPAVHAVATPAPAAMTDQQLADALDAICTHHPGACSGDEVTAANLHTFVAFTCTEVAQLSPGPDIAAWQAAWQEIGPLVVSSGRWSR